MPVARYFLFVGGVLLALMLAIDALFSTAGGRGQPGRAVGR